MQGYIAKDGTYYEADTPQGDPIAPSAPSVPGSTWDATRGAWKTPAGDPDPKGFRMAIPLDTSVPDADKSAMIADPRCGQFLWAIEDHNWAFAQAMYNSLKSAPGTQFTLAEVETLGELFETYNLPLTA